jgi:hypothetical protein
MTQTTRTVNDLILSAFYLIGEFDEEDTIPGVDFERAFDLINLIIDHFSDAASYIPITEERTFALIPGQREYIFSNVPGVFADVQSNRIASLQYCNIVQQDIWWPVNIVTRTPLFNNYYNLNVTFRPTYVLVRQQVEKTILQFFPAPNQTYDCQIQAKFYINKFEKFQPIRNTPLSLQRFFIYALGRELLQYYPSGNWSATAEDTYQTMMADLLNTNDIDLSVRSSALIRSRAYNYNSSLVNIIGG